MKPIFKTLITILLLVDSVGNQTALAQFSSEFMSARPVGKNQGEITLMYSNIGYGNEGNSEKYFDNLGLLAGVGISPLSEIRFRYDRLTLFGESGNYGINTIMAGPKFSTKSGKFAAYIPIGLTFAEDSGNSWQTDPTLLFSFPLGGKVLLNFTPSYRFGLEDLEFIDEGLLALHLGLGITVADSWIIRPEGGLIYVVGYSGNFYNFGLGLSRKLGKAQTE